MIQDGGIIWAKDLKKTYAKGKVQALKGVSFEIKKGECFGFLGHNGAGKTTIMKMIYGLSEVDEGTLNVFGERISNLTPPSLKKRLGVVPQEDSLDPDLDVLENLEVTGRIFGLSAKESRARAKKLLFSMGLEEKEKAQIETLSGGLKRRLVITRALINEPEIIILDEPTTGLDPAARYLVWQKLRGLKETGATLILTTHYMQEAAYLCDRLVIMHEGIIMAEGSPEELVKKHIPAFAVEIRTAMSNLPTALLEKIKKTGWETIQMIESFFLYADDEEALLKELQLFGLKKEQSFLRPSTLEDVFLKLTEQREVCL